MLHLIGGLVSYSGLVLLRETQAVEEAPSILLAEDDPALRDSLTHALQGEGFDVVGAANGLEALELLRGGLRPSTILLDVMMPVMDGWDFRREQLADPALRHIPVVIVTATGFSAESVRAQFGEVELLSKPVPMVDLLEILDRTCGRADEPLAATSSHS